MPVTLDKTPAPATFTRAQIMTAINEGFEMAAAESRFSIDSDRFTWPVAATLTYLDDPAASWSHVLARHVAYLLDREAAEETPATDDGRTFTRDGLSTAVNRGVDDAAHYRRHRCASDIDNLAVNAVLTLLDTPEASFADVTVACYGEDADEVAGWLVDAA
ncbi:hypothetical protein [Streptomyces niveus]|uniref:hypothetical protein n=1 Tax=Streptomyces niveus TaxID=193462 RepID=UPI00341CC482